MKIKRNVNGQEMEFELTGMEVYDAHKEYEFDCTMEDVQMQCEDYKGLTDEDIKKIANKALRYIAKNDSYYEAYWDSVNMAIDEYVATQQNN